MKHTRLFAIGVAVAAAAGILALAATTASAETPTVFAPDSSPYGKSYGEWSGEWWAWSISGDSSSNPTTDEDGHICNENQPDDVHFLASNFGGTSTRTCTISEGNGLMVVPGGVVCFLHLDGETEEELQTCAEDELATIANVSLDVDGQAIDNIDDYLFTTPLFDLDLPADNVVGVDPGAYQALAVGYSILLEPLSVGEHVVHAHDEFTGDDGFISDVTYTLTVEGDVSTPVDKSLPPTGSGPSSGTNEWALVGLLAGTGVLLLARGVTKGRADA